LKSLEARIDIDADPETVFDLIHDYARRLDWDPFLKEARLVGGAAKAGVGVRSVCAAGGWFSGLAMETIYISFDRPSLAAVKMTNGPVVLSKFAASIAVEPGVMSRSTVIYRFNLRTRPGWLRFVMEPVAGRLFQRETRLRLIALKRHLEGR
jgi:hypothetical protein